MVLFLESSYLLIFFVAASCSLGSAQASIDATREYMTVRKQFNTHLKDFQVSHFKCTAKYEDESIALSNCNGISL